MPEHLDVFLHDVHIGTVSRGAQPERVRFVPNANASTSTITLTEGFGVVAGVIPSSPDVSNFFGGYAPEGNHRAALARERRIGPDDLFALLREFGGSIAGALTFRTPDESPAYRPRYDPVDDREIARLLKRAIEQHDLGVHDDSRSMIPGFQPKLLLAKFGTQWLQPRGRAHSTHIVKPQLRSRPHTILHEHYAHQLATHIGLADFHTELIQYSDMTALAIQRYDRHVLDGRSIELVHQEDFAQALGLDWTKDDRKFQDRGRPRHRDHASTQKIMELLGSLPDTAPAEVWLRQLTFTILIGDNDAHAKNFALLHSPGRTRIAPLYDAVPNLYQPDRIEYDLALAVDGEFDLRSISVERIEAEARSWGILSDTAIRDAVGSTVDSFGHALEAVPAPTGCDPLMLEHLVWQQQRLQAGLSIGRIKPRSDPIPITRAVPRAPRGSRTGGRFVPRRSSDAAAEQTQRPTAPGGESPVQPSTT